MSARIVPDLVMPRLEPAPEVEERAMSAGGARCPPSSAGSRGRSAFSFSGDSSERNVIGDAAALELADADEPVEPGENDEREEPALDWLLLMLSLCTVGLGGSGGAERAGSGTVCDLKLGAESRVGVACCCRSNASARLASVSSDCASELSETSRLRGGSEADMRSERAPSC